jgi:hypothetical protein
MVLEETLVFHNEEDADEFISFLRENHCRAQKLIDSYFFNETLVTGPIKGVIQFYEREVLNASATGETPEKSAVLSNLPVLQSLKSIRDLVRDLMSRCRPGEIIYTTEEYEKYKSKTILDVVERMKSAISANPQISPIDAIGKMGADTNPVLVTVIAMEGAGWVTTDPDGIRLVQKNDPDELPTERRVMDPDMIDQDALKEFNLTLHEYIYYRTKIRLVIDPRIHIACSAEDVDDALEDMDVDDDSAETLLDNMNNKNVAINSLLSAISEADKCSIENLIAKMKDVPLETPDSENLLTAHFSPEYITSIVNDLRKIGAIEGNDRKLRAA